MIEDKRFRRGDGLEGIGGDELIILEDGERNLVVGSLLGERRGVEIIGTHGEERDALFTELLVQLGERRGIAGGHGAIERQEHDDDGLGVLERLVQADGLALGVGEAKIGDLGIDLIGGDGITGASGGNDSEQHGNGETAGNERAHGYLDSVDGEAFVVTILLEEAASFKRVVGREHPCDG